MYLEHLYLHNFRNYEKVSISFSPDLNWILGENAQGKTNLIEAIYFLSTGKSFRTNRLSDLIRYGQPFFYIEAHFAKEGLSQCVKISFDGQMRKMQYNQTTYPHFSNLLGLLPSVLFAPEDVSLISGSPAERRRFLDLHIAQMDPLYVHHLTRYFKAMKQRNHLLRHKSEAAIEMWEYAMAFSASYLIQKRLESTQALNAPLKEKMLQTSDGRDTLEIHYQSTLHSPQPEGKEDFAAFISQQFQKNRKRDMYLGNTLIGPHRDDILFNINGKLAKTFSSEGQKRCAVATLRLAEWERLKQTTQSPPLMSVDDFGVHLDPKRRQLLKDQMQGLGQVFLTAPTLLEEWNIPSKKHTLMIEKGSVIVI